MAKARKIPWLNPDQALNVCLLKIIKTRVNQMYFYERGTVEVKDIQYLYGIGFHRGGLKNLSGCLPAKKI